MAISTVPNIFFISANESMQLLVSLNHSASLFKKDSEWWHLLSQAAQAQDVNKLFNSNIVT